MREPSIFHIGGTICRDSRGFVMCPRDLNQVLLSLGSCVLIHVRTYTPQHVYFVGL